MTAPRRTLRRSEWYAASSRLRAGAPLSARERSLLRRRGMLHEECRLSGRGQAAYVAARLGVPVLEARILAALYAFRRRLGSAADAADAPARAPVPPAPAPLPPDAHLELPPGSAPPAPPASPLPRSVPMSYSALLPLLAGRSPSRMRSAVACLVGRGLAVKRGRELVCIAEDALGRLSELDSELLAVGEAPP